MLYIFYVIYVVGVCGHAGVFSQVNDLSQFLQAMLKNTKKNIKKDGTDRTGGPDLVDGSAVFFLNSSTIELFTEISNISLSSRALGWDTNTDQVYCI